MPFVYGALVEAEAGRGRRERGDGWVARGAEFLEDGAGSGGAPIFVRPQLFGYGQAAYPLGAVGKPAYACGLFMMG